MCIDSILKLSFALIVDNLMKIKSSVGWYPLALFFYELTQKNLTSKFLES